MTISATLPLPFRFVIIPIIRHLLRSGRIWERKSCFRLEGLGWAVAGPEIRTIAGESLALNCFDVLQKSPTRELSLIALFTRRDYCFGKEEHLSSSLVDIVQNQNFDGIDIDYEYCYDIAGAQSGRCGQRTGLYSDTKAQTFLDSLTSKLRTKLDALQASNGYNRGRYEITHAPMDIDVSGPNSKYFQILKARKNDLDFLMPQFYNGVTRPGVDGFAGTGAGSMSAASLFDLIANGIFSDEPSKVIFGFCVSDCSGTGSNINGNAAVKVLSDLKVYNQGKFSCNGGAFFWVALHDVNGSWSKLVLNEVSATAGCSSSSPPTITTSTSSTSTSTTSITTYPSQTSTTDATILTANVSNAQIKYLQ